MHHPKTNPYIHKSNGAIVNITIKNIVFILKSKGNSSVNQDLNRVPMENCFGMARRKKLTKILCYKPMIEIRAQRSFKESIKFMLSGSVNMYPWKENISRFLQRLLCELSAEERKKWRIQEEFCKKAVWKVEISRSEGNKAKMFYSSAKNALSRRSLGAD